MTPCHLTGPSWLGPNMDFGDGHSLSTFNIGRHFGATVCAMASASLSTIGIFVSPRFALAQVLSFPGKRVTALAWSPSCLVLAVATSDCAVSLFLRSLLLCRRLEWSLYEDPSSRSRSFLQASFPVTALSFRSSDSALLLGGKDGQLEMWTCHVAELHAERLLGAAKHNRIGSLPAAAVDVLLWKRGKGLQQQLVASGNGGGNGGGSGEVLSIACSPDGRMFATRVHGSRFLRVWFPIPQTSYAACERRFRDIISPSSEGQRSLAREDRVHDVKQVADLQKALQQRMKRVDYQYLLLPHPCDLDDAHVSWYPYSQRSTSCSSSSHMLFSFAADRMLRFWAQSLHPASALPSFQLFHVVNAAALDCIAFSWLFSPLHSSVPFPSDCLDVSSTPPVDIPASNPASHNPTPPELPAVFISSSSPASHPPSRYTFVGVHPDGSATTFELRNGALVHLHRTPAVFDAILPPAALPLTSSSSSLASFLFAETNLDDSFDFDLFLCISGRFFYSGHSASPFMATNPALSSLRRTLTVGRPGSTDPITRFVSLLDHATGNSLYISLSCLAKPPLLWVINSQTSSGFPFRYHPLNLGGSAAASPVVSVAWMPPSFVVFSHRDGTLSCHALHLADRLPPRLQLLHEVNFPSIDSSSSSSVGFVDHLAILAFPFLDVASPSTTHVFAAAIGVLADGSGLVATKALPFCTSQSPVGTSEWRCVANFPADHAITSLALSPMPLDQTSPISLFSGHKNGMVRLWHLKPLSEEDEEDEDDEKGTSLPTPGSEEECGVAGVMRARGLSCEQLFHCFSTGNLPVDFLEPAYFGRIATFSRGQSHLKVWELESSVPCFKLEWEWEPEPELPETLSPLAVVSPVLRVDGPTPVAVDAKLLAVDWFILPNQSSILALATGDTFYILYPRYPNVCQPADREQGASVSFKAWGQWTIDADQLGPICEIKWTVDAGIVLLCGETTLYYPSEFLSASMATISPLHSSVHLPKSLMSSIPQIFTNEVCSPLPHYHPAVLLQHVVSDHTSLISEVLSSLKEQLVHHKELLIREGASFSVPLIVRLYPFARWLEMALQDSFTDSTALPFSSSSSSSSSSSMAATQTQDISQLFERSDLDNPDLATSSSSSSAGGVEGDSQYEVLTDISLGKLTRPEQMALLAAVTAYRQTVTQFQGLDRCGRQYLVALKMSTFLKRFQHGASVFTLDASHFAWALQSEAQEQLVQGCFAQSSPSWEAAKAAGMGFWIKSLTLLRATVESIAQAAYMKDKEPGDAALWYLALEKRRPLSALFKLKGNKLLAEFLAKDPSLPDNRRIACSNAYDQLAKRKYYTALAFFVLAGSLKDVVHTCLTKLEDVQLAMVLTRLVTKADSSDALTDLLTKQVIPHALATHDSWLHHIALWHRKDFRDALEVLLPTDPDTDEQSYLSGSWSPSSLDYIHFLSSSTILKNSPIDLRRVHLLRRRIAYCFVYAGLPSFAFLQYNEVQKYSPESIASQTNRSQSLLPSITSSYSAAQLVPSSSVPDTASALFDPPSDRASDLFGGLSSSSSSSSPFSFGFGSASPPASRASDLFGSSSPPSFSVSSFNSFNAFSFASDEPEPEETPAGQEEAAAVQQAADYQPTLDMSSEVVVSMDQWQQRQVCLTLASLLFREHELISSFPSDPQEASGVVACPSSLFGIPAQFHAELTDLLASFRASFSLDAAAIARPIQTFLDSIGLFRLAHWFRFYYAGAAAADSATLQVAAMQHFKQELRRLEEFVLSQLEVHSWVPIFYSKAHAGAMLTNCLDLFYVFPSFTTDPIISEFFSFNLISSSRLLCMLIIFEFQEWALAPLLFVPLSHAGLIPVLLHLRHRIDPSSTVRPISFDQLASAELASDSVLLSTFERKVGLSGRAKMLQYAEYTVLNSLMTLICIEILISEGKPTGPKAEKPLSCLRRFDQCFISSVVAYFHTLPDSADGLRFLWKFQESPLSAISSWVGRAAATSNCDDPWDVLLQSTPPNAPVPRIGAKAVVKVHKPQCLFWAHMIRSYPEAFPYVVNRSFSRWPPQHASWTASHRYYEVGIADNRIVVPPSKPDPGLSLAATVAHNLKVSSVPSSSTNKSSSSSSSSSTSSRLLPLPTYHTFTSKALAYSPSDAPLLIDEGADTKQTGDHTCFRIKGIVHGMACAERSILAATTIGVHELTAFATNSSSK
ncbi:MAG: hypothetical protein Q8P67_22850, partial [archaeon]|nr:hypothetical protein [archaeon]